MNVQALQTTDNLAITAIDTKTPLEPATTPVELATQSINGKYADLGGSGSALGSTTTAVTAAAGGTGFVRQFQNGVIGWNVLTGAHVLHGPILTRWNELGADKGFLGFPTTDVTPGNDVRAEGCFAHFEGGSIYWAPPPLTIVTGVLTTSVISAASMASATVATIPRATVAIAATAIAATSAAATSAAATPAPSIAATSIASAAKADSGSAVSNLGATLTNAGNSLAVESSAGAFEVHGAIRDKYLALGAEASILGYPRTDESGTPDGVGRFNHFQGGSIYWTPGTSAHEVHGLIRGRWSSLGWETNPQLGYPISDELIPDPRVGHRRPETLKKPILSLPSDVVKLPADAAAAGFPNAIVNTPATAATIAKPSATASSTSVAFRVTPTAVAAKSSTFSALGQLSDKPSGVSLDSTITSLASGSITATQPMIGISATLDPALLGSIIIGAGPASTPAAERSVNRFADFESGVLFWKRGATAAITLSPVKTTRDGTSLSFSGADVAAAAVTKMGRATFESNNAQLSSMTFVGTSGYSFDGSQTHNRRHRLQFILNGVENQSFPFGLTIPQPVTATIELLIEVWFDAAQRRIALMPTDWTIAQASSGSYGASVIAALRTRLDPLLWTSYEFITLPDTDGGAAIAVLSVKTLANGAVVVFTEPHGSLVLQGISEVANAVAPSVHLFS
jgi:hypothetical protein